MRKPVLLYLVVVIVIALAGSACGLTQTVPITELAPSSRQERTVLVVNKVLDRFHYRKFSLDDAFAEQIFDSYLKALDPNRSFFLQWDVTRLRRDARRLDDDLKRGKLEMPFEIFRLYRRRVDTRVDHALAQLQKGFELDRQESYTFDRSEAPWAKDEAELDEIWRKRVKNDWLGLKIAGKREDDIRELLTKRYQSMGRRVDQLDGDDVFQTFVNAYTESIEPHTSYMSPSTSENFDISMRLSLEGIGAVLRAENEHTVVQRTITGGPAQQSGQMHTGDRIVGVAQGLDGEMEDVIGWRLDDVVEKIRGPKGTLVRLLILPKAARADATAREISLVRKEINLEEQAAKSFILDDLDNARGVRIGVLEIPAFYRDFKSESRGGNDFRSTTRDVRELLQAMERKGVDGVVIDLRGNGGGSLTEATSLTGLFVDQGPVVQVKDSLGKIEIEKDPEPGVVYSGPLAVLVDRNSASASEIFAAAVQDYGRGLVVGEPTFGKGTVQTLIDLNRYVPGSRDDLGRLRLTMAEFYRISGGSTQLKGVVPDVELPTAKYITEYGERALTNPLPWARIQPARFQRAALGEPDRELLRRRSGARIGKDSGFQMLIAQEELVRELDAEKTVSLEEATRRAHSERRERAMKRQRDAFLRAQGLEPVDEDDEDVDDKAQEKQRQAISRIQAREAARILADAIQGEGQTRPRAAMRE